MTPAFGDDNYGMEKVCLICDSPTQSHPAPNGWLCHSCVSAHPEDDLLESIDHAHPAEFDTETRVECYWCAATHTLNEANTPGTEAIRVGVGYSLFDSCGSFVWVSCPECAKATEYLTTEQCGRQIANAVGTDLLRYSRREGWSL